MFDINLYTHQHQQFQTEKRYISRKYIHTYYTEIIHNSEKLLQILRKWCFLWFTIILGRKGEKTGSTETFCQLPYFLGNWISFELPLSCHQTENMWFAAHDPIQTFLHYHLVHLSGLQQKIFTWLFIGGAAFEQEDYGQNFKKSHTSSHILKIISATICAIVPGIL